MILMHQSLKRSKDIMTSLSYLFKLNCKTIDGVIETFNNTQDQGFMLKIFYSYNRDSDLAVWIFESLKDKCIKVAYSNLSNVDDFNNYIDTKNVNFKEYPIVKEIKIKVIEDIFKNIHDYYNLNEKIEMPKDFKI